MHQPSDESRLLRSFLNGNQEALRTLCEHYEQPLRRVIRVYLDPNVARRVSQSDIIQETWLHAVRKLERKSEPDNFSLLAWLRQIAKERIIDAHRRHRSAEARSVYREKTLNVADESVSQLVNRLDDVRTGPLEKLAKEERQSLVKKVLDTLSPIYRDVLVLRFLEQHSLEQCAEILGITAEGAKTRQRRAVRLLSDRLSGESWV